MAGCTMATKPPKDIKVHHFIWSYKNNATYQQFLYFQTQSKGNRNYFNFDFLYFPCQLRQNTLKVHFGIECLKHAGIFILPPSDLYTVHLGLKIGLVQFQRNTTVHGNNTNNIFFDRFNIIQRSVVQQEMSSSSLSTITIMQSYPRLWWPHRHRISFIKSPI